jgi:secreted trypsin-like serine protease
VLGKRSLTVFLAVAAATMLLPAGGALAKAPRARSSIIGGRPATLAQWGFTVAVTAPKSLCSGAVISSTQVLTTAHCVSVPSQMSVIANVTSLSAPGGETRAVTNAAIHPGYDGRFNDLAILTLAAPTSAPAAVLASPAVDSVFSQPGAHLAVAGFGTRNPILPFGKPKLGILTAAEVTVSRSRRCVALSSAATELCDAGGRAGVVRLGRKGRPVQRVVCLGDSGGPLIAQTSSGPRLIGIAEGSLAPAKRSPFGFVKCGLKGFPSVHGRVGPQGPFFAANNVPTPP